MSRFIETIRISEGKPVRLGYHQRRVHATSMNILRHEAAWDLSDLLGAEAIPQTGIYKCRITYDREPLRIEFEPYTIQDIRSLKLVHADNINYDFKYADRSDLNGLFALRDRCDDILIVKDGRVTDTSYGNVVLSDSEGIWFTPADCLLAGTMRQYLLDNGVIIERVIRVGDLKHYSTFKVINALREWQTTPADVLNID
jgi:4-amino-4-deoxychorismate lyase